MTNASVNDPQDFGKADGSNEIAGYPVHRFASLFPMMSDGEINDLAEDIKKNGLHEPIVMFEKAVLDGRNRLLACLRAGVSPTTTEYDGDPKNLGAFVVSANLHRRHLTESQRAMVAAELVNTAHGGDRKSYQPAPVPIDAQETITQAQAAAAMKVSARSVGDAVAVKRKSPELAAQVIAGEVPVKTAAAQIRQGKAPKEKAASQAGQPGKTRPDQPPLSQRRRWSDAAAGGWRVGYLFTHKERVAFVNALAKYPDGLAKLKSLIDEALK